MLPQVVPLLLLPPLLLLLPARETTALPRTLTDDGLDAAADAVRRDGFVILQGVLPPAKLTRIRQAFGPVLAARLARAGPDRGPGRYYATPPFVPPFFDPEIFQHPDILGVVQRLVGNDAVMCQWAADTPHFGSKFQDIHRDAAPLFPEAGIPEPPVTQLAVNFPLVAVLPPTDSRPSNGPFEMANATQLLSVAEGQALIDSGSVELKPAYMELGDVMVRDVRGLHRGTPNLTPEPREMVTPGILTAIPQSILYSYLAVVLT